jgi:TetR/AcrR family transcriptional repressor of mexJK operon
MNNLSSQKKRGRPINQKRRNEIIQHAGKLFGELGFQSTTMEKIANDLGISKMTLYSRFSTKEELLSAVIHNKCTQYLPDDLFKSGSSMPVDEFLFSIVVALLRLLSSKDATNMEKLVMGSGPYRDKLGELYYKAGPRRVKREITEQLKRLHREKHLAVNNPTLSTNCLAALIKGSDIVLRSKMNIAPAPTEREIQDYCREVVRIFMVAHAP